MASRAGGSVHHRRGAHRAGCWLSPATKQKATYRAGGGGWVAKVPQLSSGSRAKRVIQTVVLVAAIAVLVGTTGEEAEAVATQATVTEETGELAQEPVGGEITAEETGSGETIGGTNSVWTSRRDAAQFFQVLLTIVAILVGGAWVLYTFVIGRSIAGVVHIRMEPKDVAQRDGEKFVVVAVTVKNTGRTEVKKVLVQVEIVPIPGPLLGSRLSKIGVTRAAVRPVPPGVHHPDPGELFVGGELEDFEPGQEAVEEVLLSFGEYSMANVEARFIGYAYNFVPRLIKAERREGALLRYVYWVSPQLFKDAQRGQETWRSRKEWSSRIILYAKTNPASGSREASG